jgi:hypothetical protein
LLQLVLALFNNVNVCEKRFVTNPLEDKGSREWDEWNEMDIRCVSLGFF